MDIVQQTINYDVAIEMIAKLRSEAIRRKHAATSEEERQAADAEIKAYNADESVLNGYGSDDARTSVYDKVFRFYGPMVHSLFSNVKPNTKLLIERMNCMSCLASDISIF